MTSQERELTLKERFVIKGMAYGIINNWYDAYTIIYEGKKDLAKIKSLQTIVSRWKNNPSVKAYFDICKYNYIQEEERKKEEILNSANVDGDVIRTRGKDGEKMGENVHTKGKTQKLVDFSNPQNQMQKLNELVNSSEDVGETLDALKVIIQTQKADRDAAREGKVVRCYLPMTCNECPLLKKGQKKVTI